MKYSSLASHQKGMIPSSESGRSSHSDWHGVRSSAFRITFCLWLRDRCFGYQFIQMKSRKPADSESRSETFNRRKTNGASKHGGYPQQFDRAHYFIDIDEPSTFIRIQWISVFPLLSNKPVEPYNINIHSYWKSPFFMGNSTISTGPEIPRKIPPTRFAAEIFWGPKHCTFHSPARRFSHDQYQQVGGRDRLGMGTMRLTKTPPYSWDITPRTITGCDLENGHL